MAGIPLDSPWTDALANRTDYLLACEPGTVFRTMTEEFEATLIRRALAASAGRRIDAARLLGIGRSTLTRKIHILGLGNADGPNRRAQKPLSLLVRTE